MVSELQAKKVGQMTGWKEAQNHFQLVLVDKNHAQRLGLQAFIAETFYKTYHADVRSFCDVLVGCQDAQGHWLAALGYSHITQHPAFLEQYLHLPVEQAICAMTHQRTARKHIVEVGNLAAVHPGAGRFLIVTMTQFLKEAGFRWVVFTATRTLLNSFKRLHLNPCSLGAANPKCLQDQGKSWGAYYDTQPQVMCGDIARGYAALTA